MAKWWEDPDIVKNAPPDIQEAIRQAAEEGRGFDETSTNPGIEGTPTSN